MGPPLAHLRGGTKICRDRLHAQLGGGPSPDVDLRGQRAGPIPRSEPGARSGTRRRLWRRRVQHKRFRSPGHGCVGHRRSEEEVNEHPRTRQRPPKGGRFIFGGPNIGLSLLLRHTRALCPHLLTVRPRRVHDLLKYFHPQLRRQVRHARLAVSYRPLHFRRSSFYHSYNSNITPSCQLLTVIVSIRPSRVNQ